MFIVKHLRDMSQAELDQMIESHQTVSSIFKVVLSLNKATRPTPQVQRPRTSKITTRIPMLGRTFRYKDVQARSIRVTKTYASQGWFGSPYALQNSFVAKKEHSMRRAARIGNTLWRR